MIHHITRSMMADHMRCERKFRYRHVDDVEPEFAMGTVAMRQGTLGHYGLQAGYNWMAATQKGGNVLLKDEVENAFILVALEAMASMVAKGTYEYRGETQPLGLDPKDKHEEIRAVGDSVQFFARHRIWDDFNRYRVIATEIPFDWDYPMDEDTIRVSGVFDVLFEDMTHDKRVAVVGDHKFVGDVNSSLAFLPLDVQLLTYEAIASNVLIHKEGFEDVELLYNMIRREVPPGFGHRSLYTPSGQKSKASTNPDDYLRRASLWHSKKERASIESNFLIPALKRTVRAKTSTGPLLPTVIRTGGEACGNCDFFARCKANLIGRGQPRFVHAS